MIYIASLSGVSAGVCEDHVTWLYNKSNDLEDLSLSFSLAGLPDPCTLWDASTYRDMDDACSNYHLLKAFCSILEDVQDRLYPTYETTLALLADYTRATVNLGMLRYIRRLERPRKRRRTNPNGRMGSGTGAGGGVGADTGSGVGSRAPGRDTR